MGTMHRRRGLFLITVLLRIFPPHLSAQGPPPSSEPAPPPQHANAARTPSAVSETTYRNSQFAFTYKVPFGWVDRTQQMQDPGADPQKSKLLLAVFERPPEAVGDTINSAVVIAAESVASYPGLKTAADFIAPLTELTASKGFQAVGDPSEISIGITPLVRLDFSRDLGKLAMRQSSLVLVRNKFVVSFTFIAASADELDELISKLSFNPQKSK